MIVERGKISKVIIAFVDDGINIPILLPTACRIGRNILGVLGLSYVSDLVPRGGKEPTDHFKPTAVKSLYVHFSYNLSTASTDINQNHL